MQALAPWREEKKKKKKSTLRRQRPPATHISTMTLASRVKVHCRTVAAALDGNIQNSVVPYGGELTLTRYLADTAPCPLYT